MEKICANGWCKQPFEITKDDLAFYDAVSPVIAGKKYPMPAPTLCPSCRGIRRYTFRNERKLYRRKCAKTGKNLISVYHPESPHTIYCAEAWWSDDWDAKSYGRDIDWNHPFFQQFAELYQAVPHLGLINVQCENSDYVNQCGWSKNCYMAFITDYSEDCYYTDYCFGSRNCMDSTGLHESELCYGCVDCGRSYTCFFCRDCIGCNDCAFCNDCKQCKNCFGCAGLRGKEHHIFNEPVSANEWKKFKEQLRFTPESIEEYAKRAEQVRLSVPHAHATFVNCTDSTGNYLTNCKHAECCFDGRGIEDCKYCSIIPSHIRNSQDMCGGVGELLYEGVSTGPAYLTRFTVHCWNECTDALYSIFCMNGCRNIFGCVGLKKGEHCILNKQYTKEEYEKLVPRLIEYMKASGEWGEFFPASISPFGYNETIAQDYCPRTKEEAQKYGLPWREMKDEQPAVERIIPAEKLPQMIDEIPDDILNWAIACKTTGRLFRVVKQELEFYRRMRLPVPRLHPDERYGKRMLQRSPRTLYDRTCGKCGKAISTTYAPDRPEIVFCEECYLKEVY